MEYGRISAPLCAAAFLAISLFGCSLRPFDATMRGVSPYGVSVTASDGGSVSVNPEKSSYEEGDAITIEATADAGYVFVGWSGDDAIDGRNKTVSLVVGESLSIRALFARREWTILMYMAADNELEPAAIQDVNELERADFGIAPVTVLALLDRAPGYDATNGDWTDTRMLEIQGDAADSLTIVSKELACPGLGLTPGTPGELDLSSPEVLKKAVQFASENYEAKRVAVVVWGHGTGWKGVNPEIIANAPTDSVRGSAVKAVAIDETSVSFMRMGEVAAALEDSGVSVIGFDTCFGATMENAWELRDAADYLVGCVGVDPDTGWNYEDAMESFSHSDLTSESLCAAIVGQFGRQYPAIEGTAITAIDLAKLPEARASFERYFGEVAACVADDAQRAELRSIALGTGILYLGDSYPSDAFADAAILARAIRDGFPAAAVDAAPLLASIDAAIIDGWSASEGRSARRIGAHIIPFALRGVPAARHDEEYVRGSGASEQGTFVRTSTGWVPTAAVEGSFLDVLFYRAY